MPDSMRKLRALALRILGLLHWRRVEDDFAAELESHVTMHIEDGIRAGLSPEEARRQALIQLGGVEKTRQAHRERATLPWMESIVQDVRYALRDFCRNPAFTVTVIATLALGIGVNAAIFTVFDNVLLREMPVRKPATLVLLRESSRFETGRLNTTGGSSDLYFSYPAYQVLRSGNRSLDDLAASSNDSAILDSGGNTGYVNMQLVSGNYFGLVGVQPILGRVLTEADDRFSAANAVVVLSEAYWRNRFGGDPSILNRTVKINGETFTVVGVVRHRGLMDWSPADIFLPISLVSEGMLGNYTTPGHVDVLRDPLNRWLNIIGRLSPGVTRAQAGVQLNTVWWNWRRSVLETAANHISDKQGWLQTHLSMSDGARGIALLEQNLGEPLKILQTMALLVLLIACANVANMLLAKVARRQGELAVRGALGASRNRIFQQNIVEGLLLGLSGATAGMEVGWLSLRMLVAVVPTARSLHHVLDAGIDWRTIAFCALAGIVTSVLFSLAPAIQSMRIDLLHALHLQSGALTASGGRLRSFLVAAEISLSLALIAGAAVLGWNLYQLSNIRPGFAISRVLMFSLDAGAAGRSATQMRSDYESLQAALRGQAGVSSVTYASEGLISGSTSGDGITVAGYAAARDDQMVPDRNWVSPTFFSTMQIPLLAGREFAAQDAAATEKVAIVDEAFVQRYFGGDIQRALRGRFGFGGGNRVKIDIQIVGVIPTIRATSLTNAPSVPFLYLPYDQAYGPRPFPPATFYVRTSGDPARLSVVVRSLVHKTDADLILSGLETMREHLGDVIYEPRLLTTLSLTMGGLALLLAALGLHGLLMLAVTQRTREIGIRMALGADHGQVSALILSLVSRMVLSGTAVGALIGWAGVRVLAHRDAGLAQTPLWLFVASGAFLIVVMAVAAYLPARRAASIDPMQALRAE